MVINNRYKRVINKLLLVLPFSIVMSLVGIASGIGFTDGWVLKWLKNLIIMIPTGYLCAVVFLPLSEKIVTKIEWKD